MDEKYLNPEPVKLKPEPIKLKQEPIKLKQESIPIKKINKFNSEPIEERAEKNKSEPTYIGLDGKVYQTNLELETANIDWKQSHFPFKGQNGQYYPTMEDVNADNQQYYEEEPRHKGR